MPLEENSKVVEIGQYAFYGAKKITSIPHYPYLEYIYNYAFANTSVLEYTVPKSVIDIDETEIIKFEEEN